MAILYLIMPALGIGRVSYNVQYNWIIDWTNEYKETVMTIQHKVELGARK